MNWLKAYAQPILFSIGLVLFGLALQAVGWERLQILMPILSGPGASVFFIYSFMAYWDVWGWRVVFSEEDSPKVRFWELYFIRLAGEALNNVTPFMDVGGEPLKVLLASGRFQIPKKNVLSSCVMARTALLFSEILFVMTGLGLSFFFLPMADLSRGVLLFAVFLFFLVGVFLVMAQQKGIFLTFLKWLEHLKLDPKLFEKFHMPLKKVDDEIASFYSRGLKKLWLTVFCHFAGWAAGGLEMYVMLRLVGVPVTWTEGMIFEALLQLLRSASFFIPGNLGAQEAGLALFVELLGFHPALGVAVSLLKRVRQMVWTAVGFLIWGIYQARGSRG